MVASVAGRSKERKASAAHAGTKGVKKPRREHPVSKSGNADDVVIRPEGLPDDAFEIGEDITPRISFVRGYFRYWRVVRKKYADHRGNFYSVNLPEKTLKMRERRLPGKGENEDDVEPEEHYFKRWMFCYHSKRLNLTQFVSHKRGRRTREAIMEYFKEVTDRLWLHSDGAPLYKCYDVCELITRVSCLVHMRRPFFKLKDTSDDAGNIVRICDRIFHEDRLIKEEFPDAEERRKQRVLKIAPLLYELKAVLDRLSGELVKEKEPELYNAVAYALKEYPSVLRCLEDGSLDLSNNVCERQIRRVAKYRNNSLFVGSPESAERTPVWHPSSPTSVTTALTPSRTPATCSAA